MRLALLALLLCSVEGYRILTITVVPSRSHHHLGEGIIDALLDAGHEVAWATPYQELTKPRKNLRVIGLPAVRILDKVIDSIGKDIQPTMGFMLGFTRNITALTLESQELRDALVKEKFDAVITEWFFNDADAAFAAILQVPWISLSSVNFHVELEKVVDEVRSLTTIPHMFHPSTQMPMPLWSRALNLIIYGATWVQTTYFQSRTKAFYEETFGPLAEARGVPLPPLSEAIYNVSILFVNSHPSFAPARSVPPNVVDIGGYHIKDEIPPLPKDLQDIMDSSKCVVYFSMGSVFKSSGLSEGTRAAILETLGRVPCTVLWKFEVDFPGAPKNVHMKKWFPQASILAHPKVKVFITHGGLLSTLEALHAGVPLLAAPVFGDQPANARRAADAGFARVIDVKRMAEELGPELDVMLKDDSYYHKAKELSKLFKWRPVPPKKLIPYYVELAIESKGAYHLRSPSQLYAWYERWALDVLAVELIVLYVVYLIARFIFRTIKSKLTRSSSKPVNKKADKKKTR